MFENVKDFYEKHKQKIIVVGGAILVVGTGFAIANAINKPIELPDNLVDLTSGYDDSRDRAILEGFGAVYKDNCAVPFASKEVAIKFMEERGKNYQLDILGDVSVIWISE